ncbi:MAG: DUF6051 family protein, partial [Bacteroidota bacterium]|nr:DUF6051 family protein [Bacteroidota bacterium]
SSATALPVLRERFNIPMIGMVDPGARLAVEKTIAGRIGLIATETTVRSKAYSSGVSRALARGSLPEDTSLKEAWQQGEQAIALVKDHVIPAKGIVKTLCGKRNRIPILVTVRDFPFEYTHENPFPINKKDLNDLIDQSFQEVFNEASAFLN